MRSTYSGNANDGNRCNSTGIIFPHSTLVDKEEGDIPQLFKGAKTKQPEVEVNLKETSRSKTKPTKSPRGG